MREKVLIVDDIELNREILAVALGDEYEVLQASDGVQTIEILKTDSEGITVMLLDLIMPNVDGYAVLDYMREHGLLERIPVIVISAESARDVEVKCLEMGVTDFIRKPFDSVTVRRRVIDILNRTKLSREVGSIPRLVSIDKYNFIVNHLVENVDIIEIVLF